MRKKNKSRNNFFINKLLLVCFFVMLVFSVFNIGKVVAAVDNIAITNAIIKDKTTTTDASVISFDRNKIVTEVTFHKVNDYVAFELTLKNNDSKKYTIKTISDNNSDSHIVYEYDKHENEEFNSGEEKKFIIKSTYKNEVLNVNNREVQDDVEFKITFVDEDGEESDKVIPINPQTNDKLIIYGILAIISLAGLLITLKSRKVKNSLLVLLLMIPFATKAASLSYQFDFKTDIDYFDKMVVTVDRNGTKEQIIVPYGEKMSAPEIVNIPGYNFIGFYDGDTEVDFNSNITEDTNITAKYEAIIYNISYDLNDGTVATANPLTYTVEDEFTLNNPTKQGYEFAGWTGTGLDGLTTSVKINKGTTEDLSFTANYTAGTSTPYKVIHKYQNYDLTTYTDEEQSLTGVTGTTVYPQIRHKDGFIDPTVTGVMIKADGTAKLEYTYQRDSFTYSFDSNVTSSKEAGTYLFETEITVSPKEVQGYTFSNWEDGSTDNPRTISLSGNTNVVPTYVPRDDTQYTIHHCYKNLNDGCDTTDVVGHGTTGQTIEAPRVPKTGFVTPDAANITILADGTAELIYTYNRETYIFAVGENITSTKVNGTYPYGTEITVTATPAAGYTFSKWEDNSTTNPRTITLTKNENIVATFTANTDTAYTVYHQYETVDGSYETDTKVEYGTTDQTVEVPRYGKTGFVLPTSQNVTIAGDGSSEITYTYNRETYTFAVGENITSTKVNGTYRYGTEITVTANEVAGYTFNHWEDNSVANPRTITLTANTSVAATYDANTDTAYTVHHKYQTLNNTYETEDATEHGTTGQTVNAPIRHRDGFEDPEVAQVTITGDGLAEVTYTYNRETYAFSVTDRTYLTSGSTANGTYMYGTQISVTANTRAGYTFEWNDGDTSYSKKFELTGATTLTPNYTPNTGTAYTVYHYKQQINGGYVLVSEDTDHLTGTTDTNVTPATKSYTGFTAPSTQTDSINGDGSTEFSYYYTRNKQTLTVTNSEYVLEDLSGEYYYEEEITLTRVNRTGWTFTGWSNGEATDQITVTIGTEDITVGPEYTINYYSFSVGENITSTEVSGNYPYGTEITVTATPAAGYTFVKWEDNSTTNPRTITLTDDISVSATFTANDDTEYTIHHSYQQLDGTYSTVDVTETGTTDTTVTAPLRSQTGFVDPTTEQVTILGDGSAEVTYTYDRETYAFSVTDRTYITAGSTANDTYMYGTQISVTASERAGYTFEWNDGDTAYTKEFTLTEAVTLTPSYTANDDTEYTVHHRYQQLDNTYNTVDVTGTGTTDTTVTAPLRSQTGYVDPTTEQVTILGDGSAEVTYTYDRETYTFAIGDHVTSTLAPGTYMYGTTITVTADTRQGYTFTEWENGITTASRVIVLTSDITAVATYSNNTDTPYTVNHYKQQLDGTYPSVANDTDSLTGTTEASVTPTTNTYTGFTSPATQTKQIMGDGTTTFTYNYTRNKYNLILTNTDYIQEGDISDEYYYEEEIELHALSKTGYTFAGWSDGENIIENSTTITISMGTEDVTVGPTYTINSYTITFETQGGTPQPSARVITYNNEVGSLPDNVEKEGFTFAGWYDDPDGGTLITASTLVIDDDTYYAHWDEIIIPSIICKKAVSLNTETCNSSSSSKGCRANGHAVNETITYGNIIRSDTYTAGDAFDCNVDGTGYNQRFYYVRTLDNKAVLINNKNHINYTPASGDPQDESGIYSWALDQLPTTTEWNNLSVTFDDKAARLITKDDIIAMTGVADITSLSGNWSLGNYEFLFENSNYSGVHARSTQWIEEWTDNSTNPATDKRARYRNDSGNVAVLSSSDATTSKNPVRPVIEVPLASIEDDYIVKYDPVNGSLSNQYVRVAKGDSLGTLPTPTQSGWEFLGWFDSNQFTNPITASHTPVGYETYYAKYVKSVGSSQLTYDSFELEENDTDTITFDNQADVEPRTYASSDDTIVTVDASGNITALAQGTATITITGTISNTTQTVTVTVIVVSQYYYITFDVDGGESLAELPVTKNTAAGSLPTTTKTNYTFGGWFTTTDFTTEVTGDTIITKNMTVHAKWIPNDAVAEVNNNTFYTTLQAAIDAAPTTKSTVKLLKNVEVTTPIDMISKNTDKDIILDLNGYTLSTASSAASKTNVIKTKAKLEVKNGTISSSKNDALIDVEGNTSYLVLRENINLVSTGGRACVYNTGGNALIEGNTTLTSNAEWKSDMKRGTVQTLNSGTTTIKGGTIINNRASASYAVAIQLGTVTIGTKDGIYDIENLVIQGETNGIYADVDYSLYDGLVKGKTAAVNDENMIANEEDNMTRVNDEVDGYKRLYYQAAVNKIKITLNSNGGSGTPDFITVDEGDPVAASDITTPTKGVYTFTGWYYDAELQNPVTFPFTPTASIPLYAGWSYVVDPTPVAFNMTNDVMEEYFTNINTWKTQYTVSGTKTDESGYTEVLNTTEFDTTMRTNFDAHNCSACGTSASQNNCSSPLAGDYCERPKGYDTGQNEAVDVYEYDSSTDISTLITYTTSDTGVIYNMIPGKVYKWVSTSDSNIYGYVAPTATSGRRTIYSTARNVRDLGGMEVSFTRGNTTKTGTIKYGKLYRGAQLSGGQTDVNSLTKLGITREVDLRDQNEGTNPVRLPKHDKCDGNCGTLSSAEDIIITNYRIYPTYGNGDNYAALRDAMKYVMQSVVDGDNIYFHCTIGTDRTGTLAYFLEGLLGVSEEDKLEDYELTYFYGLLNRTRFHDNLSGSSINPRFYSMYKTYDTNAKIYNFYMYGLTEEQIAEENVLIEQFRDAMIDYSN